jgi:hypothetical protein
MQDIVDIGVVEIYYLNIINNLYNWVLVNKKTDKCINNIAVIYS